MKATRKLHAPGIGKAGPGLVLPAIETKSPTLG